MVSPYAFSSQAGGMASGRLHQLIQHSPALFVLAVVGVFCVLAVCLCCCFRQGHGKRRYPGTVTVARIADLPRNRRPNAHPHSHTLYFSHGHEENGTFTFSSPQCGCERRPSASSLTSVSGQSCSFAAQFPVRVEEGLGWALLSPLLSPPAQPPAYEDCCCPSYEESCVQDRPAQQTGPDGRPAGQLTGRAPDLWAVDGRTRVSWAAAPGVEDWAAPPPEDQPTPCYHEVLPPWGNQDCHHGSLEDEQRPCCSSSSQRPQCCQPTMAESQSTGPAQARADWVGAEEGTLEALPSPCQPSTSGQRCRHQTPRASSEHRQTPETSGRPQATLRSSASALPLHSPLEKSSCETQTEHCVGESFTHPAETKTGKEDPSSGESSEEEEEKFEMDSRETVLCSKPGAHWL